MLTIHHGFVNFDNICHIILKRSNFLSRVIVPVDVPTFKRYSMNIHNRPKHSFNLNLLDFAINVGDYTKFFGSVFHNEKV